MIEFGLSRCVSRIVTVTDLRMERILSPRRPAARGSANPHNRDTRGVAGYLSGSNERVDAVRLNDGFHEPVLWAPVAYRAA